MADEVDPIGFQTAGYEIEPPEVMARNIGAGVRLASAALVSFFGSFLFAYIYLRERDTSGVWRASKVKVPHGTGIAVLACVLASAAFTALAVQALRRDGEQGWRRAMVVSELLALGALGVQCYQWAVLDFGPNSGPYASVFIAWTGFYAGVALLSVIYWMHTTLAGSLRHRHREPGPVVAEAAAPGGEGAIKARLKTDAASLAFYWYFLATVQVVTFILLYIVS